MAWELMDDATRRDVVRVASEGVLVLARDPVAPWDSREVILVDQPICFAELMAERGLEPEREPCVLMINGIFYSRAEWPDLWIRPGDRAALMWLAAGGGKGSRIIAGVIMVIVGAILYAYGGQTLMTAGVSMMASGAMTIGGALLTPKINSATPDSANALAAPSPTYNLQAQGNYARLNQPIPAIYGRVRTFPDFAAQPWAEYSGNEQYLYQLFVIGQGEYAIESVQIEDQVLSGVLGADGIWRSNSPFEDVSWQLIEPGGAVTYFPTRVLLSEAVAQQELLTATSVGPFQITDAEIDHVGIDLVAAKGLYYANDNGGLDSRTISVNVYATRLVANGAAWVTDGDEMLLGTITHTAATSTPQRVSARYPVETGRYQVRLMRTDVKDGSSRAGHDANWVGLRGYVPGLQQYGNLTLLAMRAKASDQLSSQSSRKINVIATRKLPVWSPETGWSLPQPTRSIAWALADVLRNDQYGAGVSDDTLPLYDWYLLERDVWRSAAADGAAFDYVFDRAMPAWEAIGHINKAGRALTYQRGPTYVTMRDQYKSVPSALFNMRNIERGSFKLSFVLNDENATDAVRVTYWDETIWSYSSFDCVPPGVTSNNPEETTLVGVGRRSEAAKIGHYMARAKRYRKIYGSFRTELEGRLIKPGDIIAVSHDLPEWGLSAELVSFTGTGKASGDTLTLSEPTEWIAGQDHYIALARRNNSLSGPWRVGAGADPHQVMLLEPITDAALSLYVGGSAERTRVSFGAGQSYAARCLVLPPLRMKGTAVEVNFVEDAPEVYDETGAVAPDADDPFHPEYSVKPVVRALYVTMVGNTANPAVDLSWEASGNPSYYLVEISTDGQSYTRISEPTSANCRLGVPLGDVWLRVAAVASIRGDWVGWVGNTATMVSIPANVTGLALEHPVPAHADQFADRDARFVWSATARADAYRVEVWSDGAKLSEHQRTEPAFSYTMVQNRADGGPRRAIELRVWGVNGAGESGSAAVLAVSNPQMPATVVQGQQTSEMALLLTVPLQTAADYAGTRYVVSQDPDANPADLIPLADQPNWAATVPVSGAGVWFFWAANYDAFGADSLNWSPRGQVVVVESAKGIPTVDDASAIISSPGDDPPGGEAYWAVYDTATGKIWRWNGAQGRYIKAADGGDLIAGTVAADKIAVSALSALSAYLGTISSAVIEMTSGSGWQYIRTSSKWIADGVSGWIQAANPSTGSFFSEFRATDGGSGVVLEQRGGGPNLGGWKYRTQVIDGAGTERLVVDPIAGLFKFRGRIEADDGYFSGTLASPSGLLGTVTSGYLRNSSNSNSINLGASGSDVFMRTNNTDRVWSDGRAQWHSSLISGSWAPTNFSCAETMYDSTNGEGWIWKRTDGMAVIDTGVSMGSIWGGGYNGGLQCSVSGYSLASGQLANYLSANGYQLVLSAVPAFQMPLSGESWDAMTLKIIVFAVVRGAVSGTQVGNDNLASVTKQINSLYVNVFK